MAKYELAAEMREDLGKGESRRLRKLNKIPAVLYGAGRPAWSLMLKENQLMRNLQEEAFYAAIIELELEGKKQKVFLRDLQRHPAKQLILETPFNNMQDVVRRRYPFLYLNHPLRIQFPNDQNLKKVDYPICIFHGTNDRIIPFECAEKLKDSLKPSDQFYAIEGGSHGNLNNFPEVETALDDILR